VHKQKSYHARHPCAPTKWHNHFFNAHRPARHATTTTRSKTGPHFPRSVKQRSPIHRPVLRQWIHSPLHKTRRYHRTKQHNRAQRHARPKRPLEPKPQRPVTQRARFPATHSRCQQLLQTPKQKGHRTISASSMLQSSPIYLDQSNRSRTFNHVAGPHRRLGPKTFAKINRNHQRPPTRPATRPLIHESQTSKLFSRCRKPIRHDDSRPPRLSEPIWFSCSPSK
jgi:hypothetical protein